jgi:hypothetical protein
MSGAMSRTKSKLRLLYTAALIARRVTICRVAIRWCLGDRLGPDVAAGPGAILNDEFLAEAIR